MAKFESLAEVGDRIKAFDFEPFPGRPEAYAIGTVIEKEEYCYVVGVEEDTYAPVGARIEIKVPFQVLCEFDERVSIVK